MNKFKHDEVNVRKSRFLSRVLMGSGPACLNGLFATLSDVLDGSLKNRIQMDGRNYGGAPIALAPLSRGLVSDIMSVMFFGEKLSSEAEFARNLRRHPRETVACMGAFQILPSFLAPMAHAVLTRRGYAMHKVQDRLLREIARIQAANEGQPGGDKSTILNQMISLSATEREYWTPLLLSQTVLGLWLAASHQPWVYLNTLLVELCLRPEWQSILRDEVVQNCPGGLEYNDLERLPLLDSFMRETSRMRSLDRCEILRVCWNTPSAKFILQLRYGERH
ncbi:hypothetical protein ASPACDRAFT_62008 [Aspergillus aculeatus ATCC 16872]|uniref:Uncharacterized protein n=1 Tax=Aspergillus aculeatus (strain ATCC 16872 / CBS 172.66 / WB 5094) TaxID=690307 RepID=A0A1L9WQN8_ASPA1|nr:uncharacterized protein ASPACDRAFT_62008 [Aspergillus aculeatus ATCC 16872]OJJ98503.1 hypothetical protein ASPACDRAFT_62008 [Aspergillus aculeatus ATCC 16872]